MITGTTDNSRLGELKKYAVNVPFDQQYIGDGDWYNDGVDFNVSSSLDYVVYYIGGIQYIDNIIDDVLINIFSYAPQDVEIIDEEPYLNYSSITNPKINDDVFIVRDNLSAFSMNYKLEYIENLLDLTTYAGGKFFNIINNT